MVVTEVAELAHGLLEDRPPSFEVAFLDSRVAEHKSRLGSAPRILERLVDREGLLGVKPRRSIVLSIGCLTRRSDKRLRAGDGGMRVGGEGALKSPSAFQLVASHVPEPPKGSGDPQRELGLA